MRLVFKVPKIGYKIKAVLDVLEFIYCHSDIRTVLAVNGNKKLKYRE